jgi:TfoX/Sxy family transcriptional regulator of competence genes
MSSDRAPSTTPKWRKSPDGLVALFRRVLESLPEAETRQMFGYPCSFTNGQMFAGLHQESMILRLSTEDHAEFMRLPGARQFEPMTGRPMREYVVVPESLLESESQLEAWLARAFAFARALPPKPSKAKAKRSAKA